MLLAEVLFYNCFLDQSRLCANHNICGLAQSLVVVNEKIIKRKTWQWQEQISYNRRTIIILHIRKKIIYILLCQDHCVIVCCTTHTNAHTCARAQGRIGLKIFFLILIQSYCDKTFDCQYLFYLKCSKTSIFQETSD